MKCPKCNSSLSTEIVDHQDMYIFCRCCGYRHLAQTTREEIVIKHTLPVEVKVTLPMAHSDARKCLNTLASLGSATSGELAERLALMYVNEKFNTDKTSTLLTNLQVRKLVWIIKKCKHLKGGSTWALTDEAKNLLGIRS